ncbi:hypothetical protein ST37_00820 [Vibrio sp. qd031]|uniref:LacI family DNA-binding transcriptional regulator n=1 Tax=Vibrio sp. qd031 TaxID=1603038 RepID=UPI000A2386C8|nr:LacI family DNA-binding transcriptional regulator [Vibrio sp. qd031]ORT52866.1 hypothetical protein ST37_00820 [Vibrio sp. qd031]
MTTLNDIKIKTGLSKSTISRVLNHDRSLSVSQATRELVLKVAKELNYQTPKEKRKRKTAENLITSRSHFVKHSGSATSLIVIHFLNSDDECLDPYFTSIRIGIEKRAEELCLIPHHIFSSTIQFNLPLLTQADAVVCVGHFSSTQIEQIQSCSNKLIFVDSNPLGMKSDSVMFDRHHAALDVVKTILHSGFQSPAFIGNDETRLHVFRQLTQQYGRYQDAYCKITNTFSIEEGYLSMREILKEEYYPDVVFAATDIIAIGVYRAILETGLRIPQDISIVGMNDIPMAKTMTPPLSTVWLPAKEMGEAAIDLFVERLNGRAYNKCVTLGHEMKWRDSFSAASPLKFPLEKS